MATKIPEHIPALPAKPGVYLFKGPQGEIIYVGKAKVLKKRVSSYFAKQGTDWKIDSLLAEFATIDFVVTGSEPEALLLEAHLIKEHQPKFNVLLKEGQPYVFIWLTDEDIPTLEIVRNKKKRGKYFGPFLQKMQARKACAYLIRTFRLRTCNKKIENGCLDYHLGFCAGSCTKKFDREGYLFRLHLATAVLENNQREFLSRLNKQILMHNIRFEFEKSRNLNEFVQNLESIFKVINTYSEAKLITDAVDAAAPAVHPYSELVGVELQQLLKLHKIPVTIDCFDVSHFQSSSLVGSCVRFSHGKPEKSKFRHFIIKSLTQQNDYAALQEIVARRYRNAADAPDLVVIDGGKGQLSAVVHLIPAGTEVVSLAKREETIYGAHVPEGIKLSLMSEAGRLLIALRDYTHHFAINFHRKKRSNAFKG